MVLRSLGVVCFVYLLLGEMVRIVYVLDLRNLLKPLCVMTGGTL